MTDLGPLDADKIRRIEAEQRKLAKVLDDALESSLGERMGFVLLTFSFGGPEMSYISNAQRNDMIKALEELVARLKKGHIGTSQERN